MSYYTSPVPTGLAFAVKPVTAAPSRSRTRTNPRNLSAPSRALCNRDVQGLSFDSSPSPSPRRGLPIVFVPPSAAGQPQFPTVPMTDIGSVALVAQSTRSRDLVQLRRGAEVYLPGTASSSSRGRSPFVRSSSGDVGTLESELRLMMARCEIIADAADADVAEARSRTEAMAIAAKFEIAEAVIRLEVSHHEETRQTQRMQQQAQHIMLQAQHHVNTAALSEGRQIRTIENQAEIAVNEAQTFNIEARHEVQHFSRCHEQLRADAESYRANMEHSLNERELEQHELQSQLNSERIESRSHQIRFNRQSERYAQHFEERYERQLHQRHGLQLRAVEHQASE